MTCGICIGLVLIVRLTSQFDIVYNQCGRAFVSHAPGATFDKNGVFGLCR
jgi:hypothetical protein